MMKSMIPFATLSGKMVDLTNLQPEDIYLYDVANALANQGRYNGQTKEFYSVAEHCIHLARYGQRQGLPEDLQRLLLMHDASEAFCGDIVYHLKGNLPEFKRIEDNILKVVYERFGLQADEGNMSVVHLLDRSICIDEMAQLAGVTDFAGTNLKSLGIRCQCWGPHIARDLFMKEARRLNIGYANDLSTKRTARSR